MNNDTMKSMGGLVQVCYCLEMLAVSVWIGGLLVLIGAVIPAVFSTIGMQAGARLLSHTFQGFDRLAVIAASVLVLAMAARFRFSAEAFGKITVVEVAAVGAMLAVVTLLAFYISPETVRLQTLALSSSEGPEKQSAYDAFFRFHWIARALYITNMALGVAVVYVKVRNWTK
jgi:uncharacterized membrane protein